MDHLDIYNFKVDYMGHTATMGSLLSKENWNDSVTGD